MATLTVFPDTGNPGSVTTDGDLYATSSTWAGAHDATSAFSLDFGGTSVLTVYTDFDGDANQYTAGRALMHFDTSSLTSGASISAAVLSAWGSSKIGSTQEVQLVASTISSNTTYAAGNMANFGTTQFATGIAISSITTGAYNNWTLTDLTPVNKTGITKLAFRIGNDRANTAPSGTQQAKFNSADSGSNKPKLVITYTVTSSVTIAQLDTRASGRGVSRGIFR